MLVVEQLRNLEGELGGRGRLVAMLTLAPLTPELRYILGLLGDPRYAAKPLAEICALGNILPGELLQVLMRAALVKGKLLATQAVGDGIAAVAKDLMEKAAPHEAPCYTCRGLGTTMPEPTPEVPNPVALTCETCLGNGVLRYEPTLERQKLALELAQLLPKAGGLQILNQQIASGGGGGEGSGEGSAGGSLFSKLQQLTDKVLYGADARTAEEASDGPVEGEVLEGETPSEVPEDPPEPPEAAA